MGALAQPIVLSLASGTHGAVAAMPSVLCAPAEESSYVLYVDALLAALSSSSSSKIGGSQHSLCSQLCPHGPLLLVLLLCIMQLSFVHPHLYLM